MIGRLNLGLVVIAAAALLVSPALAGSDLSAQDRSGRFRVLIPDFFPMEDADDNFGEDAADELRELMETMPTHVAIEKDEIEDNLDRFEMEMDELNCLQTRQLGAQMNAQLALCVSYVETGQDDMVEVTPIFWDLGSSQSFEVEVFTIDEDEEEAAAQRILDSLEELSQQLRIRSFCFQYSESQQWQDALRNCEQALEMNPNDTQVRQQRGRVLFEMAEREDETYDEDLLEEALSEIEQVVEVDPLNENALQLGGFIATQLGREEQGREYYGQYLELNPGAAAVRRRIAYEMYQAGDPEGALLFIEEGLEVEENPDLLVDVGNYAFAAAATLSEETASSEDSGGPSPEVAALYRRAMEAYTTAFESKGDSMSVSALRNVVNGYLRLDEPENAIDAAEQFLEAHPEEAGLWWAYGNALQRTGQVDEALDALARVAEIEPNYPNLFAIQGRWLLDEGRLDDAVGLLQQAVERGRDPNSMARLIFADAHSIGTQQEDWNRAIQYLGAAKNFDVSQQQKEELDFWHGYFLMQQARAQQEPQTVETARATLPKFQQAKQLFQAARAYGERRPGVRIPELLDATNTFIEIQEAIIQRAGG